MEEKHLVAVSILCSVIGTFILIMIAEKTDPEIYKIRDITSSLEGSDVIVQGYLSELISTENVTILKIRDTTGTISSVIFNEKLFLMNDSFIQVKGSVSVFNNRTEIIAKEIYAS